MEEVILRFGDYFRLHVLISGCHIRQTRFDWNAGNVHHRMFVMISPCGLYRCNG